MFFVELHRVPKIHFQNTSLHLKPPVGTHRLVVEIVDAQIHQIVALPVPIVPLHVLVRLRVLTITLRNTLSHPSFQNQDNVIVIQQLETDPGLSEHGGPQESRYREIPCRV